MLVVAGDAAAVSAARRLLDECAGAPMVEVAVAASRAAAERHCADTPPHAILLHEPAGGLDAVRSLAALVPGCPVVLLTDREVEHLVEPAITAGAEDVLSLVHPRHRALWRVLRLAVHRRAADEALRSERALTGVTLRILPGLFVVLDEHGCVVTSNDDLERATGVPRAERLGKSGLEYIAPEDREMAARKLMEAFETGATSMEVHLLGAGDRRLPYLVQGARVDRGGRPGLVVIGVDMTERKGLEAQLLHARKLESIGRMAGGVAHDFNNSLMAVLSFADLLLMDTPETDPRNADIQTIREATLRAADLTRQLLAFSRRQVLSPKVLELNAVVSGLDKMLRRIIGEDVELVTLLGEDLGTVEIDPGQLESALLNLAVNARDAMPKGGTLTIATTCVDLTAVDLEHETGLVPGRYLRLAVSDTGTGMSEEVRRHLFEPFYTTKEVALGTGLGLASVYGFVHQSGGRIQVETASGAGTTFHIDLPCREPAAAVAQRGARPTAQAGGGETILVADDNSMVRRGVAAMLSALGYTVLQADHGSAVLEMAATHAGPIDLLLSDVVMPQMSLGAMLQAFRHRRPSARILLMSGYTDERGAVDGPDAAGVGFLQKPFTADLLGTRVREALDRAPPA